MKWQHTCRLFIAANLWQLAAAQAVFEFRTDNASTDTGPPTDDGQSYQQIWGSSANWTLVSGTDDGANGYPDGTDSIIVNRVGASTNATRLTTENSPPELTSVASITGTGAGGPMDIIFKLRDFTIGNLICEPSADPFHINAERDRNLTIDGIISGSGNLLLSRTGGFSDGVTPDELITITGSSPNTITGEIRLFNSNSNTTNPQPSYWVADKVGAFGQTSKLTLEGISGAAGGIASLQFTTNTIGGEGAIDDETTQVFIGADALLQMDAGVDEFIGSGNLFVDPAGTGTFTQIADGTYTNAETWISGAGTVTVGAASPPPSTTDLTITDIQYGGSSNLTLVDPEKYPYSAAISF